MPAAGLVLLAGSKSTIADMKDFHDCGWSEDVRRHAYRGGRIVGLCGGFQMLGKTIHDPWGSEGEQTEIAGLDMRT
ncbi:MAG: Cobyric acid synthase [Candidatus Tokpelaia sp. JSC189]|nr:MAG: Cobyric acid synthase [Candidatus Tokpelaia sp. JSC189]